MSFKTDFLNTKPGPIREALVFNEIIKRGPPKELVPITVTTEDGSKITYRVMPDYLMIDGIRVPMAGKTAQKVADYFGMKLPTTKMSKQIWNAADTKIMPTPLSAGGIIGGKYYSGQEVVDHKISDSDSSVAYNEMIDRQLSKQNKPATLVAGHMKDIVQPPNPNKLGLYGWYDKSGKPTQYSAYTPHDTDIHTEYGAGTRLISNQVTITRPDGKVETKSLDDLQSDPTLSRAIALEPGIKRYNVKKDQNPIIPSFVDKPIPKYVTDNKSDRTTSSPSNSSARMRLLQRIDDMLGRFS